MNSTEKKPESPQDTCFVDPDALRAELNADLEQACNADLPDDLESETEGLMLLQGTHD